MKRKDNKTIRKVIAMGILALFLFGGISATGATPYTQVIGEYGGVPAVSNGLCTGLFGQQDGFFVVFILQPYINALNM